LSDPASGGSVYHEGLSAPSGLLSCRRGGCGPWPCRSGELLQRCYFSGARRIGAWGTPSCSGAAYQTPVLMYAGCRTIDPLGGKGHREGEVGRRAVRVGRLSGARRSHRVVVGRQRSPVGVCSCGGLDQRESSLRVLPEHPGLGNLIKVLGTTINRIQRKHFQ